MFIFGIATPFRHLGLNIFSCPRCYITARCRGREAKNCLLVPRCHFASPHVVSAYKCRLLFCDDSNGPAICQEITIIIENIRPSADGTTLSVLNDILQNAEVHAPMPQEVLPYNLSICGEYSRICGKVLRQSRMPNTC